MQPEWLTALALATALVAISGPADAQSSTPAASGQVASAATQAVNSAVTTTYSAVLDGSAAGMTCDNDTTIQGDGNTVDTDGLISTVLAAASFPGGAEIVLPTGQCEINQTINIPVSAPIRLTGGGIGLTTLQFWTPNGIAKPVGNGLVFSISNGASLTIDDFTINRRLGANIGTTFIGTAIAVSSGSTSSAGSVTATNVDILPAFPNGQTDSWNVGLLLTNITDPVITNVTINLPGWSNIPDPGAYECSNPTGPAFPCAIHALPSPANPVSTPANLGFGTATGIDLQGSGTGNYSVDSVIEGVTVSGGLVGVDLRQFQGATISDSKFATIVYGVRADTPGTGSESLSVANTLFTTTTGGIYTNGVTGTQLTGNYIQSASGGTSNLPDWAAIWPRNDDNDTISGNDILGSGGAVAPEFGIYESADNPDASPVSITGNTIYTLPSTGSVCLGNNANMSHINATGNALYGCATYLADANGGNGYADNSFYQPDMVDNGSDVVQFPKGITVGNAANPGSLQILTDGVQQFLVDSSGDVNAKGSILADASITAAGTVSGSLLDSVGPIVMKGNGSHNAAQEVIGNFYFPADGNNPTITLSNPTGGFPALTGGVTTVSGELTCSGNNTAISWRIDGHYGSNGTTLNPGAFAATVENDADSQLLLKQLGGNYTITPVLNPTVPGIQVVFGSGIFATFDCTAVLTDMVEN